MRGRRREQTREEGGARGEERRGDYVKSGVGGGENTKEAIRPPCRHRRRIFLGKPLLAWLQGA